MTSATTEFIKDILDKFATAYDFIGGLENEDQKYLELVDEFTGRIKKICSALSAERKDTIDDLRVALSGHAKSVYVVMENDKLMPEGIPMLAFWDAEAATKCSHEHQYKDEDGIPHYAWVQEVKVVAHE